MPGKLLFSKMTQIGMKQEAWGDRTNYRLPIEGDPDEAAAAFIKRAHMKGWKSDEKSPTHYRGSDGYPIPRPFNPTFCTGQWSVDERRPGELIVSVYDSIGD